MIRTITVAIILILPMSINSQENTTGTNKPESNETSASDDEGPSQTIRIKTIKERVEDIKGKVFDTKTKLLLLREQILHNLIADARAIIYHVNEASSLLTLEEVLYFLDNEKIYYHASKDGVLDEKREFPIYSGSIAPGNHLLSVELLYRGNGKLFTYLSGYVFKVKQSFSFYAAKGQETIVRSVGYEKGGITTRLEDRPSVRFEMQTKKLTSEVTQDFKKE